MYVRPIAEALIRDGSEVAVLSPYADVFIGSGARVEPFSRSGAQVVAHYISGKADRSTTQWQDVCKSAKVQTALRFEWRVRNAGLVESIQRKAEGRPVVLVHGGREPMDRRDGFGLELMPSKAAFDLVLETLSDCYLVQIGKADQIYPLTVDLDLNGQTSVSDVLDLAWTCDGIVTQCGFCLPLAECFGKPLLAVWASRHARSRTPFIRMTTPQKLLSAPTDRYCMDEWSERQIMDVARELRESMEALCVS